MNQQTINDLWDNIDAINRVCDDLDFDAGDKYDVQKDTQYIRNIAEKMSVILWAAQEKVSNDA